ncbi:MAG TPA: alpha/beta hydrolase [Ktedonobacteraceae bacterium]|nr:alpha/beta hydrolase [Ktedonobacteraceae bacterium]
MSNTVATDSTVQLRDGRTLGIASVGPSDGFPIFHCHGSGSSRLEVNLLAAAASEQRVRLIGLDRPGIGRSDPKTDYKLLDWPDDVIEVADQLGIERFAVQGISAGGAYALACAYKIPDRLTACGLVSALPPSSFIMRAGPRWMRAIWWLGASLPWLLRPYVRLVQRMTGSDEAAIEKWLVRYGSRLGAADNAVIANPEIRKLLVQAMAESFRQGGEGNLQVALAGTMPSGFQVEQITFEKMFLWHGEQDHIAPVALARRLAQALPHCIATFYPGEGHFSTAANHAQDILHTLNAQSSPVKAQPQVDTMEERRS